MKIISIIQARMGSTRLPGKVMLGLAGEPMLARCVERTRRAQILDEVVIATSTRAIDDKIASLCVDRNWARFRGSEDDVLDRYYHAALAYKADVVVRITSDCPMIDPEIIELVVHEFLAQQPLVDYASNSLPPRSFPRGLDVEVLRFDALVRAHRLDTNLAWREHVTAYINRNPDEFRLHRVFNATDLSHLRWTVDTHEDLAFVRKVYEHFGNDRFSWREVCTLLSKRPEWLAINQHVQQKSV